MSVSDQEMDAIPTPASPEDAAQRWLVRLHAASCSDADRQAFQAWLQASAEHRLAYDEAEQLWQLLGEAVEGPDIVALPEARPPSARAYAFADPLQTNAGAVPEPPRAPAMAATPAAFRPERSRRAPTAAARRRHWPAWLAAVAAALVAVVIGLPYMEQWRTPPPQVFATATAQTLTEVLPDGTRLTLDAQSRVAVKYTRNGRDVRVEQGTAFFEVAHDAARPFVATTRWGSATALGTQFQVSHAAGRMEVVLAEGTLRLDYADGNHGQGAGERPIVLEPGQRAELAGADGRWLTTAVDTEVATSWRQGRVIFDGVPLPEAVARMNRYLRQPLSVGDPSLGTLRISGVFRTDELGSFTLALQRTYGLRVESGPDGIQRLRR